MKKSIKLLAAGLAVVPCALVLTACGSNDMVDTSGKFTAVETSEYENVLTDLDTRGFNLNNLLGGLQMSFTFDATMELSGQETSISVTSDNYLLNSSDEGTLDINKIKASSTVNLDMEVVGQEDSKIDATAYQYITNGNQYIDLSQAQRFADTVASMAGATLPGYKFYQTLATGTADDIVDVPNYSLLSLLDLVPQESWGTDIIIEKYENSSDYKVKTTVKGQYIQELVETYISEQGNDAQAVTVDFNSMEDVVIYIVYTNDVFAGLNITASADLAINIPMDATTSMQLVIAGDLEINILGFDGEITFPANFDGYVDMNSEITY